MNAEININQLITSIQQGDVKAFDQLYFHFAPILYNRIFKIVKNPENVEEILQEVFLKIWNIREKLEVERGITTLVYRIADNLAIDYFRKACRDKAMQDELWASSVSFYLHTDQGLYEKEKSKILNEAIQLLPPKRKEILRLCNIENKSYSEVATLLGISVSTVSNQLVSAMKDIKNYIQSNYKNELLLLILSFFI